MAINPPQNPPQLFRHIHFILRATSAAGLEVCFCECLCPVVDALMS